MLGRGTENGYPSGWHPFGSTLGPPIWVPGIAGAPRDRGYDLGSGYQAGAEAGGAGPADAGPAERVPLSNAGASAGGVIAEVHDRTGQGRPRGEGAPGEQCGDHAECESFHENLLSRRRDDNELRMMATRKGAPRRAGGTPSPLSAA